MKEYLPLTVVILLGAAVALGLAASEKEQTPAEAMAVTSTFKVEGMTCGGCEAGVRMAVKKLDGVERVEASYKEGRAVVTYDPHEVAPDGIVAAIEKLGYQAELIETKEPAGTNA